MDLEQIRSKAYHMIMVNAGRNIAMDAYNSMYKSGWNLPPEIRQLPWIIQVINSDPFDAVETGVRIISTIPLSLTVQPLAPGPENEERANQWEKILKWQLRGTNRRRSTTVEAELSRMALLYDMGAVRIVDIQEEIKAKTLVNADTSREEFALQKGRFIWKVYDSRDIYFERSDFGLERVLVATQVEASKVVDEWGAAATQYPDLVEKAKKGEFVVLFDYWDLESRAVWVQPGPLVEPSENMSQHYLLTDGKNPYPFIPFAIRGGSDTERDPAHKYKPLLYPVYNTGAWDIKNIIQTLEVSEAVARSGSPRYSEEGPNTQAGQIDMMQPSRPVKMPPQNVLKQLQPPGLDTALQQVEAMLSAQLDKQMVSRILQGGELPAGVAFASLNLITRTAIGVLKPAKYLSEMVIADGFEIMLLMVENSNVGLYGYDNKEKGAELYIDPEHIDSAGIYLDVLLHPDGPVDKMQQVNTAVQAVNALDMSKQTALTEVGIDDPRDEIRRTYEERLWEHEFQMVLAREQRKQEMTMELEFQAEQAKLQMLMSELMAQSQQAPGPEQIPPSAANGGPAMTPEGMMGGGMMGGPGQGAQPFMPADGGLPYAMMSPEGNAGGAGNPAVVGEVGPEGGPVLEEGVERGL